MVATQRGSARLLERPTPLPVRILRLQQLAGQNPTCRCLATSAFGGWVATALHSDSRVGWRDRNEGVVLIFCSWPWGGCSLRDHPSQESSAADCSVARPVRDGAW